MRIIDCTFRAFLEAELISDEACNNRDIHQSQHECNQGTRVLSPAARSSRGSRWGSYRTCTTGAFGLMAQAHRVRHHVELFGPRTPLAHRQEMKGCNLHLHLQHSFQQSYYRVYSEEITASETWRGRLGLNQKCLEEPHHILHYHNKPVERLV